MEVIEDKPVSMVEIKDKLQSELKHKEGVYEQKICLEMLQKIVKTQSSKIKKIQEELKKLEFLKEKDIVMLVNIMPKTQEEVEILFKNIIKLKKEEIPKIVEILQKHG